MHRFQFACIQPHAVRHIDHIAAGVKLLCLPVNLERVSIRTIHHALLRELSHSVANQCIALHLTNTQTTLIGTSFQRLVSQKLARTRGTCIDLVLHHVLHALVICRTHKDIGFHHFSSLSVVQGFGAIRLKSLLHHDLLECRKAVRRSKRRCIHERAQLESQPTPRALHPVTNRHASRKGVGVEEHVRTNAARRERHVLLGQNQSESSLLRVAASKFVTKHRIPLLSNTDLHALQPVTRGVAIYRFYASVLSALRLLRYIPIARDLAIDVLNRCNKSNKYGILRHFSSNQDHAFGIQMIIVHSFLPLHRFLEQRIHCRVGELCVDLRRRICHLLHEVVGMVVHGLEHAPFHRCRIDHHGILLIESGVGRDRNQRVLSVRHTTSCAHDFAVDPCLSQRDLWKDRHYCDRIIPLQVVGVEPRTCLLRLSDCKCVAGSGVVIGERDQSSQG